MIVCLGSHSDDGLCHARLAKNRRLDFRQLDSISMNFHTSVIAPLDEEQSFGCESPRVAAAIGSSLAAC